MNISLSPDFKFYRGIETIEDFRAKELEHMIILLQWKKKLVIGFKSLNNASTVKEKLLGYLETKSNLLLEATVYSSGNILYFKEKINEEQI